MPPALRCLILPLLVVASHAAPAASNFLPDRDTPVPADQPIPAVDFVRPRLFEWPQLNPAGTHFAALTKTEDLRTILLVGEIATGKIQWTDREVYEFEWIDNTRVELGRYGDTLRIVDIENIGKVFDGYGYMLQFKEGI
jgi:hypothetical protein